MAPTAAPVAVGLPIRYQSTSIQATHAKQAAVLVVTRVLTAIPFMASALPALKPNQPNQSSAAPRMTKGTLAGPEDSSALATRRRPTTSAAASAETPASRCTTIPPAKSSVPRLRSQPPSPHTQCATGA